MDKAVQGKRRFQVIRQRVHRRYDWFTPTQIFQECRFIPYYFVNGALLHMWYIDWLERRSGGSARVQYRWKH